MDLGDKAIDDDVYCRCVLQCLEHREDVAVQGLVKEGHRNKEEAERRAVRNLAGKIVAQVGDNIDAAMKGK